MKFDPYDSVSTNVLREVADTIAKLEKSNNFQQTVITFFTNYFSDVKLKEPLPDFSITNSALLGTPGTVILVDFNESPFTDELEGNIKAITKMLPLNIYVPVIYFAEDYTQYIEHEKVHACQYLLESKYPLTDDGVKLFFTNDLIKGALHLIKTESKDKATRFLVNVTCYKMWTEFEAVYTTQETEYWACLEHAYRCAQPIETFQVCTIGNMYTENKLASLLEWDDEKVKWVIEKFLNFCNEMENNVEWIRSLRKGKNYSLHDDILSVFDELETERILGPIDDTEDETFDPEDETFFLDL
ncbi:MAG: hypothetical protein QQN42_07900 [Nitrosopumilus sp.]